MGSGFIPLLQYNQKPGCEYGRPPRRLFLDSSDNGKHPARIQLGSGKPSGSNICKLRQLLQPVDFPRSKPIGELIPDKNSPGVSLRGIVGRLVRIESVWRVPSNRSAKAKRLTMKQPVD